MKKTYARDYTLQELMVVVAARDLRDGEKVFVGIGIPQLAAVLAQRTHAPNLVLIYESGTIAAKPMRTPLSIGDPTLTSGAGGIYNFIETFSYLLQRKFIDVGFLGGAQIDKYGNINSTVIGGYEQPKVRLPGSGGGCDIAALARRFILISPHEKRRFVEKVDFVTSPGYLDHPAAREKLGLTGGPSAAVTTMGVLRFDDATKEMYLDSHHPGVSIEQIKENTGWDLKISDSVKETEPPTEDQVTLLREKIDPEGYYLKKAVS